MFYALVTLTWRLQPYTVLVGDEQQTLLEQETILRIYDYIFMNGDYDVNEFSIIKFLPYSPLLGRKLRILGLKTLEETFPVI